MWASRATRKKYNSVLRLNVGSGPSQIPGFKNLDFRDYGNTDYIFNLDDVGFPFNKQLPLKTDSVDEILCAHCLEHVQNPLDVIEEMHRILKPSGKLVIRVPYYAHPVSHTPIHRNYWGVQGASLLFNNTYFETKTKWKNFKLSHTWGSTHPLRNAVNFIGEACIQLFGYYIYERTLANFFPLFELVFEVEKA